MFDFSTFTKDIKSHISDNAQINTIRQGTAGDQPTYPFCTFTNISPFTIITSIQEGHQLTEVMETTFSFTVCALRATDAEMKAHEVASVFKKNKFLQMLSDKGIVVVKVLSANNRDNFLTIDSERRVGFDVKFRVTHVEIDDFEYFDDIGVQVE